ncbi:hypothetical protein COO60DRAFT_312342 [Scenedesmus sp. NREL 46B-D3]|nr:hypothetical protein COO60DRAFT_312342 [Scenedesmus sp. NREL 46B-D3]
MEALQTGQHTSDQDSSSSVARQPAQVTCQGASLVLPSPPTRQRSKQLEEHLSKLQDKVDQQRYAAMVADVAQQEQQAAAAAQDPFFPTTKLQMSYGLHVLATMGAFSVLGYYAGRLLLNSNAWAAVLGALGLAAGLLLETSLLIIRTNMPVPLDQKYAHLLDKRWDKRQDPGRRGAAGGSRAEKLDDTQLARKVSGGVSRPTAGHVKFD